jgi:hypothetical protein
MRWFSFLLLFAWATAIASAQATLGQVDTFSDGTTMSWSGGSAPVNIANGGPAGNGDRYLQISANANFLATFNLTRWNGNYSSAGINRIECDLKNVGANPLVVRLVLFATDGSRWSSISSVSLDVAGAWTDAGWELSESNFQRTVGSGTFASALAGMERIMLRHEPTITAGGTTVTGALGIDNFSAPAPPAAFDFVLNKTQVAGQNFVQGTVSIPVAAASPTVFSITDNTSLVTSPATATIATGQLSRNFAIQVTAVNFPVQATVSARLGTTTITRPITLVALIPTALAFTPSQVVGGNSVSCRVVVNGVAGPGGRTIAVFDNSPFTTMPSTVVVPPGGTQVIFDILTSPVTTARVVTVTARVTQGEKTGTFRINP